MKLLIETKNKGFYKN